MIVVPLQSGSSGNCTYVEALGVRLLIDAGISGRQAQMRLAAAGFDIEQVDAVLVTHDHVDHSKCVGIFQRKFGLPIYASERTLAAARARHRLGRLDRVHSFRVGQRIRFGPVTVETIGTPHDGVDGAAMVVDDGRRRLGVLTDLGHVFDALGETIASLDAALLESNYDPDMLQYGPYPEMLRRRIRGAGGHLSNGEAAELLERRANGRLQWACLAHLSGDNNEPQLAVRTHREACGDRWPIHVADRAAAMGPLCVE